MLWWTLRQLRSADESKRIEAVKNLGRSRDVRAFEHLISSLTDTSFEVRAIAAQSLGEIADTRAIEPLLKLLEDESASVRQTAIRVVDKLGEEHAKKCLVRLLKDNDSIVRQTAADALKHIESPEVKQSLSDYRSNEDEAKRLLEQTRAKRLAEEKQREAEAKRRAQEEGERARAAGPRQKESLTLQEALIFAERTLRESGGGGPTIPFIMLPVTDILSDKGTGKKVRVETGDEVAVATLSMLIMSLVFFKKFNGLIVTDSRESASDFFARGGLGVAGFRASDVAHKCGKNLTDAESLFERSDFKGVATALSDHDSIVVMDFATFNRMNGPSLRHVGGISEGLRKANCVIKVSPGTLEVDDGIGVSNIQAWAAARGLCRT